jgi:hypothetical protein
MNNHNIQDKFYKASIKKISHKEKYINKENMIFIKPNFKLLEPNEKLNKTNYDFAFYFDLKNTKSVNKITSKQFISSDFPYLVLVRNRSKDDNVVIVLQTPKLKTQCGGELIKPPGMNIPSFDSIKHVGPGFKKETARDNGWKLDQYNAPLVDIDKLSSEHENHDVNLYPSDPMFGAKEMDGLVKKEKDKFKNYETGFTNGFDNGYHKGYYFGYSAAAAYLYRFYKKYYTDYMNKYEDKVKDDAYASLDAQKDKLIAKITNPFGAKIDEAMKTVADTIIGSTILTGGNDPDNLYEGLPMHMLPDNVLSLEALQPRPTGIFYFIDLLLGKTPPPSADPSRHCYRPDSEDLNNILRKNFHPKFRDAIMGVEENWDDRIYNRSCNKFTLKFMKYCPYNSHPGVEFDSNIGKYHKICKRKEDDDKGCIIM